LLFSVVLVDTEHVVSCGGVVSLAALKAEVYILIRVTKVIQDLQSLLVYL